jgi:hypothetical protein
MSSPNENDSDRGLAPEDDEFEDLASDSDTTIPMPKGGSQAGARKQAPPKKGFNWKLYLGAGVLTLLVFLVLVLFATRNNEQQTLGRPEIQTHASQPYATKPEQSRSQQQGALAQTGYPQPQSPLNPETNYASPRPTSFPDATPQAPGRPGGMGLPPMDMPPASSPEMSVRLEAFETRLTTIEQKLQGNLAQAAPSSVPPAIQQALTKMTAELQKSEKENLELKEVNAELTRRLKEAEAAMAKMQAERTETPKPSKKKKPEEREISEDDKGKGGKSVRILALFGNGAVLQADDGQSATVEEGQSFHGYKIERVDFQKGTVTTNKGVLKYAQ